MRRGYNRAFPVFFRIAYGNRLFIFPSLPSRLQPCASMQKQSQSPLSNSMGSNLLSDSSLLGFLYLWLRGTAITATFPVFFTLGVFFKRPIACFETTQKKDTASSRCLREFESGGKAGVFSEKKPPIGGYRPSSPCRLQPAYFLEQRRFNAKAIAIAPKIAAYVAGSGTFWSWFITPMPCKSKPALSTQPDGSKISKPILSV